MQHGDNDSYTGENIKVLEGLEAVRLRQHVHRLDRRNGLHHLVYEVVDNSVDEALAATPRRSTSSSMWTTPSPLWTTAAAFRGHDGSARRRPVAGRASGAHQAARRRQIRRFNVQSLRGLHGVGVSCVNALSEEFEWRSGVRKAGEAATLRAELLEGCSHFETAEDRHQQAPRHQGALPARQEHLRHRRVHYDTLAQRLREMAFLNKAWRLR